MFHLALRCGLVALVACRGSAATPPAPPASAVVTAAPVIAAPVPAQPVTAPPIDAAPEPLDAPPAVVDAALAVDARPAAPRITIPAKLLVRPRIKGKPVTLAAKSTVKLGGVAITFKSRGHGHKVGGGTVGFWSFELVKGGKVVGLHLTSGGGDDSFQAEVIAHGSLFVFEHRGYSEFSVVRVTARAPRAIEDEACVARIDEAAKRAGIADPAETSTSYTNDPADGIVVVARAQWTGFCGRYTKRIWFGPRRPPPMSGEELLRSIP